MVGCYINLAERGEEESDRYLTQILWSGSSVDHETVEIVRVVALTDNTLKVTGEASGKMLHEEIFTAGKDFTFKSGKIIIKRKLYGAVDVFTGVIYESIALGIDEHSDGKYTISRTYIGLAFILMPVANQDTVAYRFRRVQGSCHE